MSNQKGGEWCIQQVLRDLGTEIFYAKTKKGLDKKRGINPTPDHSPIYTLGEILLRRLDFMSS